MLMKALQDQIAGRSQEGTRKGAVLRLAWSRPAKPQVAEPGINPMPSGHWARRGPNQGWLGREMEALLGLARDGGAVAIDWRSKYPCTRMHGADFESEFYSGDGAERE